MQQQPFNNCGRSAFEAPFLAQQEFFAIRVALLSDRQQLFFSSAGLEQQHNFSDATTGLPVRASAVIAMQSAFKKYMMPTSYLDLETSQYGSSAPEALGRG